MKMKTEKSNLLTKIYLLNKPKLLFNGDELDGYFGTFENYVVMKMIDADFIPDRIAKLRTEKNISARDMSLSLGQSQSYINNIENKKALPSMQMFLYICEFLQVKPKDFFEEKIVSPSRLYEAIEVFKSLSPNQLDLLISIAKEMK